MASSSQRNRAPWTSIIGTHPPLTEASHLLTTQLTASPWNSCLSLVSSYTQSQPHHHLWPMSHLPLQATSIFSFATIIKSVSDQAMPPQESFPHPHPDPQMVKLCCHLLFTFLFLVENKKPKFPCKGPTINSHSRPTGSVPSWC